MKSILKRLLLTWVEFVLLGILIKIRDVITNYLFNFRYIYTIYKEIMIFWVEFFFFQLYHNTNLNIRMLYL